MVLRAIQLLFLVIAFLECLTHVIVSIQSWHMFTKPLLMPLLMFLVIVNYVTKKDMHITRFIWLLVALFFSGVGDVFLLLNQLGFDNCFLIGMAAFFCAHIAYIYIFTIGSGMGWSNGFIKERIMLVLPFLMLGVLLNWSLWYNMKGLAIPVLCYTIIIIMMLLSSLNRWGIGQELVYKLSFYGAFLFMLSDMMIAISTFGYPFPLSSIFIMSTYIIAQYLIVQSVIKQD